MTQKPENPMALEVLERITKPDGAWSFTGSRHICNPAPQDTDADYVAWVNGSDALSEAVAILSQSGFDADMSEHYQDLMEYGFISWKRGEDNIILTKNKDFYDRHCIATSVCKQLNLLDKRDRIMLFQAVLYANFQPPAEQCK